MTRVRMLSLSMLKRATDRDFTKTLSSSSVTKKTEDRIHNAVGVIDI